MNILCVSKAVFADALTVLYQIGLVFAHLLYHPGGGEGTHLVLVNMCEHYSMDKQRYSIQLFSPRPYHTTRVILQALVPVYCYGRMVP